MAHLPWKVSWLLPALEHLNLAWAYCGFTLRLPVVHQSLQLLMDASGLGPRTLPAGCARDMTNPDLQSY